MRTCGLVGGQGEAAAKRAARTEHHLQPHVATALVLGRRSAGRRGGKGQGDDASTLANRARWAAREQPSVGNRNRNRKRKTGCYNVRVSKNALMGVCGVCGVRVCAWCLCLYVPVSVCARVPARPMKPVSVCPCALVPAVCQLTGRRALAGIPTRSLHRSSPEPHENERKQGSRALGPDRPQVPGGQ